MHKKESYIYGPVPSRRLGSSLGVDLIPRKTCDYDCIYCQFGRITLKTTRRDAYIPAGAILDQLERRLEEAPELDYITVSGSGEPTLNSELGEIVMGIKRMSELPLAVITNGSLLGDKDVAEACVKADLVMPSLDAADEKTFRKINRPCRELDLHTVVDGIAAFRKMYQGTMWLEVFIVEGVNSDEEQLKKLGALIDRIGPDKVQLNTATRPPAEAYVHPVKKSRLEQMASILGMHSEAIESLRLERISASSDASADTILQLLKRRPCTIDDVSRALNINYIETSKALAHMEQGGLLSSKNQGGIIYYYAR